MEAGFIPAGNTAAYSIQQQPQTIPVAPGSKVIRAPGLKRGKTEGPITDRVCFKFILLFWMSTIFQIYNIVLFFFKSWFYIWHLLSVVKFKYYWPLKMYVIIDIVYGFFFECYTNFFTICIWSVNRNCLWKYME